VYRISVSAAQQPEQLPQITRSPATRGINNWPTKCHIEVAWHVLSIKLFAGHARTHALPGKKRIVSPLLLSLISISIPIQIPIPG